MPSPGEDIQSWSVTAADNGTADPLIVWSEGQARASVNNSSRSEMAAHAKNRNLLNGSIVTTGSANAQQFLSGLTYTTIPTGLVVRLKIGPGLTNTAPTTLNMDGLGALGIKTATGDDLLGGELVADGYADLLYNGSNWVFLYSREFFFDLMTTGGGIILGKQIFTTVGTQTYAPTPGMDCCIIEVVGGGGGSGAASSGFSELMCGGGGGGGAYARTIATAAEVGASQLVTVGAGGVGSLGTTGKGADGSTSSFGALCAASGGQGGGDATIGLGQPSGGIGGAVATGDFGSNGGAGGPGFYHAGITTAVYGRGGSGGSSVLGGGGLGSTVNIGSGQAGGQWGGGAGGSSSYNAGGLIGGAPGSSGIVIVTEFGGKGAPGRDGATGAQGPIGPPGPAGAGTGDVLVSGTPTTGQIAQWTDTSHITGVSIGYFSTGDAKLTLKTVADTGWVLMNDGTIGNAASGSSTRANADCLGLFALLFNAPFTDAICPILTSTGGPTTRATFSNNPNLAWAADCRITLTRQLGRSLAVAGAGAGLTSRALGSYLGAETVAGLPSHTHVQDASTIYSDGRTMGVIAGTDAYWPTHRQNTYAGTTAATGSGATVDIMQPSAFWNIMIKL